MTRAVLLGCLLVPLVARATPPAVPRPPEEIVPSNLPPPDPWLHDLPFDPDGAPWAALPRELMRPVKDASLAAAIARLEPRPVVALPPAEAAALVEQLPTPAAAQAAYLAACEAEVKEGEAQTARYAAQGRADVVAQLRPHLEHARAQRDAARKLRADAFRPYLVRCLDFGYMAAEVSISLRGTTIHTQHAIMSHGYPTPVRQPFVLLLPFAPTDLFVTVMVAA